MIMLYGHGQAPEMVLFCHALLPYNTFRLACFLGPVPKFNVLVLPADITLQV